ncbi:MAG: GAF and ANTAR domain-containing protein [Acidimicrobiales bacterium]
MAAQQRVSEVFVELADTLVDVFDVVEFLTTLADRIAELLDASAAGVVLADESGALRSVASSNETARLLDLFELQNQEGPCLDCFRTGNPIVNASLLPPDRWPTFGPEARRLGFHYAHAVPMRLRERVIGAVNIFTTEPTQLADPDVALARALADIATIALLQERSIREARVLNEQLQAALHSRVVIEQAKGMLAERRQIEMDAAFALLRSHARNHNQKLSDVAIALLDGTLTSESLGPSP